jgi:hypothetical protein
MSAKKAAAAQAPRGLGNPNVLYIADFATGDKTFRVETELRRNTANAADFNALVKLAKKPTRTIKERKDATKLVRTLVGGLAGSASLKRDAIRMFKIALGLS